MSEEELLEEKSLNGAPWKTVLRNTAYIVGALLIFLLALDIMLSSLQYLGKQAAETIILATSNPFTGLFIGLLITALIQSSSAVTSMVVALVASGAMTIEGAVPIIMGANIGTTITSIIVSLGFITRKKEFKRAVAAGAYHNFFNLLTALILFPLEYFYGFLSGLSEYLATVFFNQPAGPVQSDFTMLGSGVSPMVNAFTGWVNNGFVLVALAIALLYGSILFFRKVLTEQLGFRSQDRFQRFFFQHPLKSFSWGLLTTAAIRSSTITTSLVVPLVAKKMVKLRAAAPFIMGANVGTTITAFLAALFNSNAAISIAIAHFLFNFIGVLFFFVTPYLKEVPMRLAIGLGRITLKYRLAGFLYLLVTFFFVPFSLIYLNKDAAVVRELTYERSDWVSHQKTYYKVITKTYENQQVSSWMVYDRMPVESRTPDEIYSVYRRKNMLFINNELYELNKPGFCRDAEDKKGKYQLCIREVIPQLSLNPSLSVNSVYVFERKSDLSAGETNSVWYYISAEENVLVKKEVRDAQGQVIFSETLYTLILR